MSNGVPVKYRILSTLLVVAVLFLSVCNNLWSKAYAQGIPSDIPASEPAVTAMPLIEVINPYLSIEHLTLSDGTQLSEYIIKGPPFPPIGYEAENTASTVPSIDAVILPDFPSYSWVFGCSAVSGAMIAAYFDRGAYPNMYSGPTDGGVMPLIDTSWGTWSDGYTTYPNNPLIASHNGVDGLGTRGSIDDYWIKYLSAANDPYITNDWPQHTWGSAIGDYMKTSQSTYGNVDGSTSFYNYSNIATRLTCSAMEGYGIDDEDGTYGRKLFYEARGYTVSDCYSQNTDNKVIGGFSLANFQTEINAGYPVLLNLAGHSIVGYGYDGSTIYLRNTWNSNPAQTYTMPWGGSYSGMELLSVSIVHPTSSSPNPIPAITNLNPSSATAGGVGFTLTVNGTNFISSSKVRWNGANRTTSYVSNTQLQASITAADIASAGTATVTIFNPTPGGGTSNGVTFTINNPIPTITNINPSSATAGVWISP